MGQRSNCHRTHHETQEFRFLPGIYTLDLQPIRKQEESIVCTCRLNLCVCVWGGGGREEWRKFGENISRSNSLHAKNLFRECMTKGENGIFAKN